MRYACSAVFCIDRENMGCYNKKVTKKKKNREVIRVIITIKNRRELASGFGSS